MFQNKSEIILLLEESRKLLKVISGKDLSSIYYPKVVSPIAKEIAENINLALNVIKKAKLDTVLRFELINKAINAGYWDLLIVQEDPLNPNNPIVWGDTFHKLLGCNDEVELPGILDSWWSRIHADDQDNVLQAIKSHLRDYSGSTPYDVEYRLRVETGEYRWFRSIGTTIRDEKGAPLRTAGIIHDINDHKLKEQELQFLLRRLELISSAMEEGGWSMSVVDYDLAHPRTEVWWSPQFRHLLGYNDECDFPNKISNWRDSVHPEDWELFNRTFIAYLQDFSVQTPYAHDYRIRLKGGGYCWVRANAIKNHNGEGALYCAGTIRSIEHEKRKEQYEKQIITVNNQLNTTLESISEGIIVIDSDEKITQINRHAIEMVRAGKLPVVGRKISELLNCGDYFKSIMISGKKIDDMEKIFSISDGLLNCIISVSPFMSDMGKTDGLVVTLKEIQSVHRLINRMTGSQARFAFESIIGRSEKIIKAIKLAKIAANSSSNVLLVGDSGTGKEMFAQAIHNQSERRDGPFIAINCGALPRGLIESELFGYEGGAFTGSRREGHPGKFELANSGTILLDEIGDMPLEVQVSLLRVLQNKVVIRVGGKKAMQIDVRIIAATNKNLELAIKNQTFRDDLYYRLNVFSIKIPSLRERSEDIGLLGEHFINKYNAYLRKRIEGVSEEVRQAFLNYHWPGNIRELENVIERAINIAPANHITLDDLPPHIANLEGPANIDYVLSKPSDIRTLELDTIIRMMEKNDGNIRKSARELGIGRSTLYRKLREAGLDYATFRNTVK